MRTSSDGLSRCSSSGSAFAIAGVNVNGTSEANEEGTTATNNNNNGTQHRAATVVDSLGCWDWNTLRVVMVNSHTQIKPKEKAREERCLRAIVCRVGHVGVWTKIVRAC